ncbi:MAG TPA: hypothetical protein VKT51_03395 [Candidatus Eremiobacteraceae bacterium]|nr:hypothetical protein [Candidatus Eremiobacteraceae bacterium]
MRRIGFLSLAASLALAAFALAAPAPAAPALAAPAQAARATVVLVWSVSDPMSSFADVRRMDVALRAPFEIGALVSALHDHPGARFAIEVAPDYVAALRAAAVDPLGAAVQTPDAESGEHTRDVLGILTHVPLMDAATAASNGGLALVAYAVRARCDLNGNANCRMRPSEMQRAAALHAAASLAMMGSAAARALLHAPPAGADALSTAAGTLLAQAARQSAAQFEAALKSGALEAVATPDGDPILPLLIDSGGKSASDPTAIPLDASADAVMLIANALATAATLNKDARAGLSSPFGAYDDAAAQAIGTAGARFAIFSSRVVRASQAGGSVAALGAANAAPYQLYDLQTSKSTHTPVLFWDDASSQALESIAPSSPPEAFANRLAALAQNAAIAAPGVPAMIALRVRLDQLWAQRADAPAVISDVARTLGARDASATPSEYVEAHQRAVPVYGFPSGSSLGTLDAFDGTPNQQALWSALAAARFAASGGGIVTSTTARSLILRAEAGTWYRVPELPLPPDEVRSEIDRFRSLLAGVYRAAGKTPPATIAPQRTPAPSPAPASAVPHSSPAPASAAPNASPAPVSATPKPSPSYPQGL